MARFKRPSIKDVIPIVLSVVDNSDSVYLSINSDGSFYVGKSPATSVSVKIDTGIPIRKAVILALDYLEGKQHDLRRERSTRKESQKETETD